MDFRKHRDRFIRHLVSMPFIYMIILPIILLDIMVEIYHHICFPLYGITKVNRSNYILIDRHKLAYLSWSEKINCVYCGYANGFLRYSSTIAGETEKYWCGIKHHKQKGFKEPEHHKNFLKYGDEKAFKKKYGDDCKLVNRK